MPKRKKKLVNETWGGNNKNPFHILFSWYATHVIRDFFFYPPKRPEKDVKREKTLSLKYRNEVSAQ